MNRKLLTMLLISVTLLLLTGCADVTVISHCVSEAGAHIYGFWGGLWHGLTVGFSFIGQLFSDNIAMYAVANNGGWYNFGYWLGVGGFGYVLKTIATVATSLILTIKG